MDPLSLIIGAGILGVGWLAGRFRRPARAPKEPRYICGCGDHLSEHDPQTGRCHGTTTRDIYRKGDWEGEEAVACTCRQYVGPRPLDMAHLDFPLPKLPPPGE